MARMSNDDTTKLLIAILGCCVTLVGFFVVRELNRYDEATKAREALSLRVELLDQRTTNLREEVSEIRRCVQGRGMCVERGGVR